MFLILTLVTLACGQSATPTPEMSQEDTLNTAIAAVMETQAVSAPTSAPALPTETAAEPQSTASGKEYSWNFLASQESGGVTITIGRVVVAEKSALPKDLIDTLNTNPLLADKELVAEIVFVVENKNSSIAGVYPYFGKVLLGSEQIELMDFWSSGTSISEAPYGGDVLPGARLIGGLWFGLSRTNIDDINSMTIYIDGPHDSNFNTLGDAFNFTLDLSQKQFAPYPDELK